MRLIAAKGMRALHRALPLLQPGRSLRFAGLPPGEDPDSLIRTGKFVPAGIFRYELLAIAADVPIMNKAVAASCFR